MTPRSSRRITLPRPHRLRLRTLLLSAWGAALVGAVGVPLLAPGVPALRDMLVLDYPALSAAALGWGALPARATPQDGLLALAGLVVPASWVMRALLVGAAATAVLVAARLAASRGPWQAACAMMLAVLSPFAVERLLQGHWALVIAAWLLPALAIAGLRGRWKLQAGLLVPCSLTVTGALCATLTAVVCSRTRRRALGIAVLGVALWLPWLIPSLLPRLTAAGAGGSRGGTLVSPALAGTASSTSASAFAPSAEAFSGTLGSLLGGGGIWNAQAVPLSRQSGAALLGIALTALLLLCGGSRVPRRLLALAAVGLTVPVAAWLLPDAWGWLVSTVPGGGLVRDAQKFLLLGAPAAVCAAAALNPAPAVVALLLAVGQVPDAPVALQQLRPVELDQSAYRAAAETAQGRTALVPGTDTLATINGRVVVEPWTKAVAALSSGALSVDGTLVDPPQPAWLAATDAWRAGDLDALEELGVGVVMSPDGEVLAETAAPARSLVPGLALHAFYLAVVPAVLMAAAAWRRFRSPATT